MNLEQIGLGLALTKMQYKVYIRTSPWAYGYRATIYITLKSTCTEEQKKCIEVWAQSIGVTVMDKKQIHGDDMMTWIEALEPFYSLMNQIDIKHIKKIKYLRENPMPRVAWREDGTRRSKKLGKNWKKFMYWVEAWDAFCEELDE